MNNVPEVIRLSLSESSRIMRETMGNCLPEIEEAARKIAAVLKAGGQVLIFGNGGSAGDSQHFAAELVGRFKKERKAYAAIALTVNGSILTALANDYDYGCVFERQVQALGGPGDAAIGISTSGGAENVIRALKTAGQSNMFRVSLTGARGSNLKEISDICIQIPSTDTPRIQEAHIAVIHVICDLVETILYNDQQQD